MLAKSDKKKNVGTLLTGFSILMFGMHTMSSAVSPLADVPEFTGLLVNSQFRCSVFLPEPF